MRREELTELADNNPEELALIFARKVVGYPNAILAPFYERGAAGIDPKMILVASEQRKWKLAKFCNDWTATISEIEKAGLFWGKIHSNTVLGRMPEYWVQSFGKEFSEFIVEQKSNWPLCAALMICAIEVKEAEK